MGIDGVFHEQDFPRGWFVQESPSGTDVALYRRTGNRPGDCAIVCEKPRDVSTEAWLVTARAIACALDGRTSSKPARTAIPEAGPSEMVASLAVKMFVSSEACDMFGGRGRLSESDLASLYQTNASMPLSGHGFRLKWESMAELAFGFILPEGDPA